GNYIYNIGYDIGETSTASANLTLSIHNHFEAMIEKLRQARCITDGLFDLIREKSLYDRPIPRRHRLIFYLGHLEAFDWNHIGVWNLSQPALHPSFDKLSEA